MGLSRYLLRAVSQFYFGTRSAWTYPDLYLGLFATPPTGPDAAGTELSGGGYARVHAPDTGNSATSWLRSALYPQGAIFQSRGAYVYAPVTSAATVAGFGLWDAASGGQLLLYGALAAPLLWPAGRRLRFAPGAVGFSVPSWLTGPVLALNYVFRQGSGMGPPAAYQPAEWRVYALAAPPTLADYLRDYDSSLPAGGVTVANDTTQFPLVGSDVTNGAAWQFPVTAAAGPDVGWLLCIGRFSPGYYAGYWLAQFDATASARPGERLEIAAGSLRFDGL